MKRLLNFKLIIPLAIIILALVYLIPFERILIRFDTPEKAFNFDYTKNSKEILRTEIIKNVAFIIYVDNEDAVNVKYVLKDNRGWIPPVRKIVFGYKSVTYGAYFIDKYEEGKQSIIYIAYGKTSNREEPAQIKDSIGYTYKSVEFTRKSIDFYFWFANINDKPSNYEIDIGTKKLKIE